MAYTIKVKKKNTKVKIKKKRKKLRKKYKGRNGDAYGQIPTSDGAENPVGGN